MPADAPAATTRRAVDEVALQRMVARLRRAGQAPWLHGEVARRMAERLAIVKLQPRQVVDWWPRIGGGGAALRSACARAEVVDVEPGAPAASRPPWWSPRRWAGARAPMPAAQVPDAHAQLVWSNMVLHVAADPLAWMRQWHRVLAVDGFLMFSTLGPGTLASLRRLYDDMGWGVPMAPLVDMHDLGDMLVETGFADPVMDQETVTLTWSDARKALAELHALGSNLAPERTRGLRTPRWQQRLASALARDAARVGSGRVELGFEIVYGHAFKPPVRAKVQAQTSIDLADMRAMVRASSQRRPR